MLAALVVALTCGHVRLLASERLVASRMSPHARVGMSETPAPPPPPSPPKPKTYEEAEKLALACFSAGDFEAAMKRFEEAKGLPGAGYDVVRMSPGSQTPGDKSQPPNPRGLVETRFASPAQLAIAEYNIACCLLKLGSKEDALQRLQAFIQSTDNPEQQFIRILADSDLAEIWPEMTAMRDEMKKKQGPFSKLKNMLNVDFVEWK